MEPISLRVLLRSVIFFSKQKRSSQEDLENHLKITRDRTRAIIRQLIAIKLMEKVATEFRCSSNGETMINAVKAAKWNIVHDILLENCEEYKGLLKVLKSSKVGESGLMISQITKLSTQIGLRLNYVITEICCEWGRRLGMVQKNLFTSGAISRFYLVQHQKISLKKIENEIYLQYRRLGKRKKYAIVYVSIPRLRENVCEILKIPRRSLDVVLLEICKRNPGDVELASGPLTSQSRTTPTRRLSIYVNRKAAVLSPKYILEAEQGLDIGGKKYQTIAFHRSD